MGMDRDLVGFVRALDLPAGFSVCDLGATMVVEDDKEIRPAREFYKELGCASYLSIDGNGENGALVADLNKVLPIDCAFDLVTDLGTGEHIFDQAQLFRSIHDLLTVGGIFVFDRPIQRWVDHGFYNMQPNLIFALVQANGYQLISLSEHEFAKGRLAYGAYRKIVDRDFAYPQQGRYLSQLKV